MTRPRTPHPYTVAAYSRRSGAKRTKNPAIIGPTHLAYPRNEGWRPKGQKGKTENGRPRKLSDITIHGITDHLTKRITRKIKPNCIRNWKKRVRFRIDLKKSLAHSAHHSQTTPRRGSGENTYTERSTSATETQRSQSTNAVCATKRRKACCT